MLRVASLALVALASAGCMTYDFEPVVPLAVGQTTQPYHIVAKKKKPNVMLLVDKSGSMDQAVRPGVSRMSELRTAMNTFLTQSASDARFGLTFYPTDGRCGVPAAADVKLPAPTATDDGNDSVLAANSNTILQRIQAVEPTGGTPTGDSLAFVGSLPDMQADDGRSDFILLLTDGLPNCNEQNATQVCTCDPNLCGGGGSCNSVCAAQVDACRCTLASCSGGNCRIGCLDTDAVVAKTRANKQKNIKTIVVGFGADTAGGDAPAVLNAIAEAGEFPRACPNGTDAECGNGNTCNTTTSLCSKAFYQAADAAELTNVLRDIINNVSGNPCEFELDVQPSKPEYIAVIVNGKNLPTGPDTWQLSAGKVVFPDGGAVCSDIKSSTAQNPIDLEIRVIETF